jgi:Ca-activated chloride channel family protein
MEFLNPVALYGLLTLPLLLIPYLIRRKPRRMVMSSLLLFHEFNPGTSGRPLGKLRLPPIFFLQLLLLALLILALGEPVFSVRPSNVAIVIDNSASMQTIEDGKPRFSLAKERSLNILAELDGTAKVDLYLTLPRLERVRAASFPPAEAASIVAGLEPYDLGDLPVDYNDQLNQIARQQKYDRLYFLTDHPARGEAGAVRVLTVGQPKANLALTALQIHRSSLASSRMDASVEVANLSAQDQKIKILLRGGGIFLSSREIPVAAGKNASATFEAIPAHAYYEAELDGRDALQLDNHRFAVAPATRSLRILAISPRPQALASLRSIPGVTLDIISPSDYETTERTGYGLEIFHFSMPAVLPRNPALFVLPPDNNSLVDLARPTSRAVVSSWREPHPLTRYVNFSLFRPSYARAIKPQTAGDTILETSEGSLAFALERQGFRYLVLGFDPFPYLGRENLPVSIFTLNVLDWFFESAGAKGKATGESIPLAAVEQQHIIVTPRGEKLTLRPGETSFSRALYQGIYQINHGGEKELFAANLQDSNESDLRDPTVIEIHGANGGHTNASVLFSFWPYLLLASLILMLLEWFIQPKMAPLRLSQRLRWVR